MPSIEPALLELDGVSCGPGGARVLQHVSLGFDPGGTVTCIIGPNGAGKTTLFGAITGFIPLGEGNIRFRGKRIDGLPPHRVAQAGIGRLFQDVRAFRRLTALENVMVAKPRQPGTRAALAAFWPLVGSASERENRRGALEALDFVGAGDLADRIAGELSYGQQKLVALARLLHLGADCLLLDEPMAGLNPTAVRTVVELIRRIATAGRTVVVIEHNLNVVRELGDWVYLMDGGRVEAFGPPAEVLRDAALNRLFPSL